MTDFAALLTTVPRDDIANIIGAGAAAIAHRSARLTRDLDIGRP